MLKITKITDYGFNILAHMAAMDPKGMYNAKDLAQATDIALPTVSKVLKILTQGKILASHQGSKGGYTLARPAEQISAAEVIEAVEGPVAITDCSSEEGCSRNCPVSPNWLRVNNTISQTLSEMTLAEMAKR